MAEHPVQIPALNLTGTDPAVAGWHRETTPLTRIPPKAKDPTVFVIGALTGTISDLLITQHPTYQHYLFEPQDWACATLKERFGDLPNVTVHQKGLGDRSGVFAMGLKGGEYCSFMRGPESYTGRTDDGYLVEFGEFVAEENIKEVYYATFNIEAYEYVLLSHMRKVGWLEKCQVLGISWHNAGGVYTWLGEPAASYAEVQELLKETHHLVLSIDNWQTWERLNE